MLSQLYVCLDNSREQSKMLSQLVSLLTRNWCAKRHKSDRIDTIFEINKAAKMASNVTNNGGAKADE